jgi:hypothetical protein
VPNGPKIVLDWGDILSVCGLFLGKSADQYPNPGALWRDLTRNQEATAKRLYSPGFKYSGK